MTRATPEKALVAHPSPIPGVVLFDLPVHRDNRGWFKENWQREKMTAAGLPDFGPVQNNISFNESAGTTRGIHAEPWDKFISIATGAVFGAWVDLRARDSFGAVFTARLDPTTAIFIPAGVGNAFQTLEDNTTYTYLVNDHWSPEAPYTFLNVADETVDIPWPIALDEAEVSTKDRAHPPLAWVEPMHGKKTLVLGANGQLGHALQMLYRADRGIGDAGRDGPAVDFLTRTELNLASADPFGSVDFSRYDTVINAAAYTSVDAAETPPGRIAAWAVNATAVAALALACTNHRITLVHISSDYVFDGSLEIHDENERLSPLGVYGQSKAAGDTAVTTTPRHYILRTTWVVGDGKNFVSTMASLAAQGICPTVTNDQYGRLTFTEDLAAAINHLLTTGADYGTYNISNRGPSSPGQKSRPWSTNSSAIPATTSQGFPPPASSLTNLGVRTDQHIALCRWPNSRHLGSCRHRPRNGCRNSSRVGTEAYGCGNVKRQAPADGIGETMIGHGRRALVFEFDTLQQRAIWESETTRSLSAYQPPPASVTNRFAGLLRAADILTEDVLIPDTQLFDGTLFLHHGPEGVRSLLARARHEPQGMSVVGRDAHPAECLRKMVLGRNPESQTLTVFECSALAVFGLHPRRLAVKLSTRANHRLKECDVQDVPIVLASEFESAANGLVSVQEPTGVFAVMAHRWQAWIKAIEDGSITLRVWDDSGFAMNRAFELRALPAAIDQLIPANEKVSQLVQQLRSTTGRSTLLAILDRNDPGLPPQALNMLGNWWSSVYFDALAYQHGCNWLKLASSPEETEAMETSRSVGTTTVQFKGELVGVLGQMPSSTFASARHAARTAISRWCGATTQQNSDGLAFSIMKFNAPIDRREAKHNLWTQVMLTIGPALLGALITVLFSVVAGIWTVVGTAVVALLATPIVQLVELYSMRSQKMKAFINIPSASHE